MEASDLDNTYLSIADDSNILTSENEEKSITGQSENEDLKSSGTQDKAILQSNSTLNNTKSLEKTKITVMNTSVVKERKLVLQLLDSNNKALANKKISINFAKKTYTNTSDKNGKISLKISLDPGKYTVKVKFAGDANYTKTNKTFTMNVYKIKTNFIVPKTSIIRGQYFIAYLKDQNNNPLASKYVYIKFSKKTYSKITDKNGRVSLKINLNVGNYKTQLIYKGAQSYLKNTKKLTIKSYNATTKITFNSKEVVRAKWLNINLKYGTNKTLANKKLTITFNNKKYDRTTNENGRVNFKISKPVGSYKIKVEFNGDKGFKKSYRFTTIKILPNYTAIFSAKNKTSHLNGNKTVKYYVKLTDVNGNPIAGETVTLKVKCNNFTYGKKGYKVIVSGIGPNYHVTDVRDYKNVCVFSLVGGIDSGMFVDMASSYYQNYLKKNNNQFVLGCVKTPGNVNLANRTWLIRAHDDDYSPKSFKGLYFPGKYLNKKTHVDYVYGPTPEDLVNNFLTYAKNGKSIGFNNTLPGRYVTYKLNTTKSGYVHLDLPIGNHTVICSFTNKDKGYTTDTLTTWIKTITTHTSLDFLKARNKNLITTSIDDITNEIKDNNKIYDGIPTEQLLKFVQELPDGYRTVFNLHAIDGYKHEEIAQMLACSESNVRSQYLRARKLLREKIENYE